MAKRKSQGVRCVNCGCTLDPGERCDCEKLEVKRKEMAQKAQRSRIVSHNIRMMEQARIEFDYA